MMLPNALPYHLKVRDYFRSETSVWEFYSMSSVDEWEITDRIVDAILEKNDKDSVFWQTARLYRSYSSLSCDRAAGIVSVSAGDPEYHLRLRALQLWQEQGEAAEAIVSTLIEGQRELGSLDVFGQERIRDLTSELIRVFLYPFWMRSAPVVALALEYFPYLTWPGEEEPGGPDASRSSDFPDPQEHPESLAGEHGSIRDYFAFVLVDFALADPALENRSIERAKTFAARLGIAGSFAYILKNHYGKPDPN